MNQLYLLVFDLPLSRRVRGWLDQSKLIDDWRKEIFNVYMITSDAKIDQLREELNSHIPDEELSTHAYILLSMTGRLAGSLTNDGWDFLESAGKMLEESSSKTAKLKTRDNLPKPSPEQDN